MTQLMRLTDANLLYIFNFLDELDKSNIAKTSRFFHNFIKALKAESNIDKLPKTIFSSRSSIIDYFFTNEVPGLGLSYHAVFKIFVNAGVNIYIAGGCVRDLLLQRERSVIDIDFSFDCGEDKILEVVAQHNWLYSIRNDFPVVIIGNRHDCCLQGIPTKFTIEAPLKTAEFSINCIYYHYNTKQLIDKTSCGFEDLFQNLIKIPMKEHEEWLQGELMGSGHNKIFRFWKMLGRGFIPDAHTQTFLIKKTIQFFNENKSQFLEKMACYIGVDYGDRLSFFKGARMLMGEEWGKEVINQTEQEMEKYYQVKEALWDAGTHNKLSI